MAGFGESLGWGDNPWYKAFDSNRNALVSGFAGLGAASPQNIGGGFARGFAQGMPMDTQRAERAEEEAQATEQANATKAFLESKGWTDLIPLLDAGQGDTVMQQVSARMQPGGAGGTEYGLTPIWGQFDDGSFGYGVQGRDGSFKQVDTGELSPLDPRSLAGERAFGAEVGGAQGAATAAAPSDIATGQIALDLIQQIKTSPELPWATGTSAGLGGNAVPGTGRYGFQNLVDQAKSGAFLSAIQEMRGMGALSNAEGQTATQAITRMNTALSQADFVKALDDYERIVRTGIQRAQGRVGSGPNVGSNAAPTGGGYTVLGVE